MCDCVPRCALSCESLCTMSPCALITFLFSCPPSPQCSADDFAPRQCSFTKPLFSLFLSPRQASVLRQPTSPPPPCPASSRPSSTASPASRISPTDTRPWRRCTPTACRPTPPRAPRQPTPSSKPSPGCSSTQVWGLAASVYYNVYYSVAMVPGKITKC